MGCAPSTQVLSTIEPKGKDHPSSPHSQLKTFNIDHLPYANDIYTVVRKSGKLQGGWTIVNEHACTAAQRLGNFSTGDSAGRVSSLEPWRVYMTNGKDDYDHDHSCGWRDINTIWPSHLTDKVEIAKWRDQFRIVLEQNDIQRLITAVYMARLKGTPDLALEKEFEVAIDAEIKEDEGLRAKGITPPFRSANFVTFADAEADHKQVKKNSGLEGFESH
jgi:hypothetical protein